MAHPSCSEDYKPDLDQDLRLLHPSEDRLYKPLETSRIRLLELFPGEPNTIISCRLHVVNLMEYNDITALSNIKGLELYQAVSYTWGDPDNTTTINCNEKAVKVTVNLSDALHSLRKTNRSTIVWIDALCVDQSNFSERAEQVRLMGLIYWKASQVHVWLGNDSDSPCDIKKAVDLMQRLHKLGDEYNRIDSPNCSNKLYEIDSAIANDENEWRALHYLLGKPWFSRVWVVQELGLAHDAIFHCGQTSFTRKEIYGCNRFFQSNGRLIADYYKPDMKMISLTECYWSTTRGSMRLEYGSDPDMAEGFLDVLRQSKGLQCSDQRDRIYAFLGHPSAFKEKQLDEAPYMWYPRNYYDQKHTLVQPDYGKFVTVLDVYRAVAKACLARLEAGLDMLCNIVHEEHTIAMDYPSWIPRWDTRGSNIFHHGRNLYYTAGGTFLPTTFELIHEQECAEPSALKIQAKFLGKITLTHELTLPMYPSIAELTSRKCRPGNKHKFWKKKEPLNRSDLALTLTAGLSTGLDLLVHPAEDNAKQHVYRFQMYMLRERSNLARGVRDYPARERHEANGDFATKANLYKEDLNGAAPGRTFFITADNRLGLGPGITRERDEIWIPRSAKMPFVLRRVEKKVFKVVGQAYVHGVMRGEAVDGLTEDDFEVIHLR